MNKIDIDNLEGIYLDAAIAENLFNWEWVKTANGLKFLSLPKSAEETEHLNLIIKNGIKRPDEINRENIRNVLAYSTNYPDCLLIIEKLLETKKDFECVKNFIINLEDTNLFECSIITNNRQLYTYSDSNLLVAICKLALCYIFNLKKDV